MPEAGLRTSALAAEAGVNTQTLRYYHRRGLLAEPERSLGGHRLYPPEAVTTVRAIKTAQRLGFTLTEIAGLLDTARRRHGARRDAQLRDNAVAKIADLDSKIADLRTIRADLAAAVDAAEQGHGLCSCSPHCPLPLAELAQART